MDKLYQIFVSSTFDDLRDERAAVQKAILDLKHFPVAMEQFPASHEPPWELIKRIISMVDYYVVIVAGRYGSVTEEGMSYTEKEYQFARELEKPILPFLHRSPGTIAVDKSEKSNEGQDKLIAFRRIIESRHHPKYWTTADELSGNVAISLFQAFEQFPAVGWVRADTENPKLLSKLVDLQERYDRLSEKYEQVRSRLEEPAQIDADEFVGNMSEAELQWFDSTNYKHQHLHHLPDNPEGASLRECFDSCVKAGVIRWKEEDQEPTLTTLGWRVLEAVRSRLHAMLIDDLKAGILQLFGASLDPINRWSLPERWGSEDDRQRAIGQLETEDLISLDANTISLTEKGKQHCIRSRILELFSDAINEESEFLIQHEFGGVNYNILQSVIEQMKADDLIQDGVAEHSISLTENEKQRRAAPS